MDALEVSVLRAAADERALEQLIQREEGFILRCAASITHRYVSKSDDEWSIALAAFVQAVQSYDPSRGGFPAFAQLLIRRRLTDYLRSTAKMQIEIPAGPEVFETGPWDDSEQPQLQAEVAEKLANREENSLTLEIQAISGTLLDYGFSFFDLATCSPKAEKTKKACARAVICLLENPILFCDLRATRQLPIKTIEKYSGVPRKILERHRKYIIAAAEILSGEYPGLAEYLRYIRKELDG